MCFCSRQNKFKKMSVFFFRPLSYVFFLTLLSNFFFPITWSDFKAFKSCKIKVHMGDLVQSIATVFINPVCYSST